MAVSSAMTSATTTLWIAATLPATYDEIGFEALTGWIKVAEVSNMGTLGGSTTVVNHIPVDTATVVKRSGSVNYGQMSLTLARHAGGDMDALRAAFKDRGTRSFKVVYPTALGEQEMFTGIVTSVPTNIAGADNILEMSVTIEVDAEVLTLEV